MSSPRSGRGDRPAWALAAILTVAGVAHFAKPDGFDSIVPRLLPGSARLWTDMSGVAEIAIGVGVARRSSRRVSAGLAALLFIAVFPANVQMAVDWRDRPAPEFALALLRLPLQIPLVWLAWRVRGRALPAADIRT